MIHGFFLHKDKILAINPYSLFTASAEKRQSVLTEVILNLQICLDKVDTLNLLLNPVCYQAMRPAEGHISITYF